MAQDKDKRPKEPFNLATEETEIEVVFESDMDFDLEEDEEPLRSNTDPKHDPKNVKNPILTPSGMGNYFPPSRAQDQGRTPSQPENAETPLSDEDWQHALRNGNHTLEGEFNGFRVRAWRADQPTDEGLHKGHLTEMVVSRGVYGQEVEVAHFKDGNWKTPLEATPERQAVMEAVKEYDGEFLEEQRQKEEQERARQREIEARKYKGKSR